MPQDGQCEKISHYNVQGNWGGGGGAEWLLLELTDALKYI